MYFVSKIVLIFCEKKLFKRLERILKNSKLMAENLQKSWDHWTIYLIKERSELFSKQNTFLTYYITFLRYDTYFGTIITTIRKNTRNKLKEDSPYRLFFVRMILRLYLNCCWRLALILSWCFFFSFVAFVSTLAVSWRDSLITWRHRIYIRH